MALPTAGLVDTHCHIDVPEFDHDREEVLDAARHAGVSALVVPGIYADDWPRLLRVCRLHDGLYRALGLHPVYMERHRDEDFSRLERIIEETAPVAVGEVGLDYYIAGADAVAQKRLFEAQVRIARASDLPLLLHIRKAHDDVLAVLRRLQFRQGGIAHAFNGSAQQAARFVEMGFKLGFGGVITFERSRKIRRLVTEMPLESIVLETDAPDLPPASHYGERNSPVYLPEVLRVVASLRNEPVEAVAAATTSNALSALPRLRTSVASPDHSA